MFPVQVNRQKKEVYREGEIPLYNPLSSEVNDYDLLYTNDWNGATGQGNAKTCKLPYSLTANRIYTTTLVSNTFGLYSAKLHSNVGQLINIQIQNFGNNEYYTLINVDGNTIHSSLQTITNPNFRFEFIFRPIGYRIQIGTVVYDTISYVWTGVTELHYEKFYTTQTTLQELGTFCTWQNAGATQCNSELQIETNQKINFLRVYGDEKKENMFNKEFYHELVKQTIEGDNHRLVATKLCLDETRDFKAENKLFVGYVSAIHSDGMPQVELYSCGQVISEMTDKIPTQPPCVIEKIGLDTPDGTFCRVQMIGYIVDNAQYSD